MLVCFDICSVVHHEFLMVRLFTENQVTQLGILWEKGLLARATCPLLFNTVRAQQEQSGKLLITPHIQLLKYKKNLWSYFLFFIFLLLVIGFNIKNNIFSYSNISFGYCVWDNYVLAFTLLTGFAVDMAQLEKSCCNIFSYVGSMPWTTLGCHVVMSGWSWQKSAARSQQREWPLPQTQARQLSLIGQK